MISLLDMYVETRLAKHLTKDIVYNCNLLVAIANLQYATQFYDMKIKGSFSYIIICLR